MAALMKCMNIYRICTVLKVALKVPHYLTKINVKVADE